jgi:hypothetical protein
MRLHRPLQIGEEHGHLLALAFRSGFLVALPYETETLSRTSQS